VIEEEKEEEETTKKSRKCSLVLTPHNRKERARQVFKWNGYSPCFHVIENEAPLSSLPCEDKKKIGISFPAHSIPTKFSSLFLCASRRILTELRTALGPTVSDTRVR
jgi:protein required for attachment to host cells